jgi:hypothetical protein
MQMEFPSTLGEFWRPAASLSTARTWRSFVGSLSSVEKRRKMTVSFLFDASDETVSGGLGWFRSWAGYWWAWCGDGCWAAVVWLAQQVSQVSLSPLLFSFFIFCFHFLF